MSKLNRAASGLDSWACRFEKKPGLEPREIYQFLKDLQALHTLREACA